MDAVKVGKYLLMETSQLLIEADGAVALGLGAFSLVGTAGTVLTLIKLLGSAVVVAPDRYGMQKKEFPVVGTQQIAVLIYPEVDCSKRIIQTELEKHHIPHELITLDGSGHTPLNRMEEFLPQAMKLLDHCLG